MFQTKVYRNYTTGFPGEIVRDGPTRAKPARIDSATTGVDPGFSTNRISRAFGYSADNSVSGQTMGALSQTVIVGGPKFFGVLIHPKHYVLNGGPGGSLSPSLDLPQGYEGEFCDMGIIVAELFNESAASKTTNYGDGVAYVPSNVTVGNNAQALPFGALFSVPAGAAAPTGMVLIPNARVVNVETLAASAAGALISAYTIIQLTQ
jgi:hypothetical protein